MKTIRFTDNLARRWLFRHPVNGHITVTLPEGAVRLDDDGYAEWDDILRLLGAAPVNDLAAVMQAQNKYNLKALETLDLPSLRPFLVLPAVWFKSENDA